MKINSLHTFHIPVMGLAYTIDSPVKVARYGIDSVISIIEDRLVEAMRKYYYEQRQEPFKPISSREPDFRARRITDYLNLVNKIVQEQVEKVRASAFEAGSEIVKYFEMLPSENKFRKLLKEVMNSPADSGALQQYLRDQVKPGAIDVNIMTKVDKDNRNRNGQLLLNSSDALAALRGYAKSDLKNSSIVFSAGLNPRLFNYLEELREFDARGAGVFDKKIVIKVSDYRSALIQGKYLAKKGIWVSEFRIESGLNCGGHAFATDGNLIGPILDEFKSKKRGLVDALFALYKPVAEKNGLRFGQPHPIRITAQGGIGTAEESEFLIRHYDIESVGWGTPFLLCPEATTVDDATLALLSKAREKDVILSKNSPLGVRFNYLKGTSADRERQARIRKGSPGSPCTEKFLVSNTEFTKEPICTASRTYQWHKINQLKSLNLPEAEYADRYEEIVSKECLCIGLSNAAMNKYGLPTVKHLAAVTVCPGPNIAYFNRTVSLREMTDHIYGRSSVLTYPNRPHVFIKELDLNISYLNEKLAVIRKTQDRKGLKDALLFCDNLKSGIEYYRGLTTKLFHHDSIKQSEFVSLLAVQEFEVSKMRAWLENAFE
ncbi:MAG TPA: hypothetical protein VGK59_23165 [Ohtaekwangia sp.]